MTFLLPSGGAERFSMTAWAEPSVRPKVASERLDRDMRRFWLRALLAPRVALRWRMEALSLYRRHGDRAPDSAVMLKPLHGYLRRGLSPAARLRHLLDHYRWFADLLDPACLDLLCRGKQFELARLSGRNGSCFRLYLTSSTSARTPREGESSICLTRGEDENPLSRLTFNLVTVDGKLALAIGGLQGPSRGGKRAVIDATRDLHGLRPKDVTLLAARAFAQALGAAGVHAVSDALHVHRALPDNPKLCSYDGYWRERGALDSDQYGFLFPPISACKGRHNARERTKLAILDGVREVGLAAGKRLAEATCLECHGAHDTSRRAPAFSAIALRRRVTAAASLFTPRWCYSSGSPCQGRHR